MANAPQAGGGTGTVPPPHSARSDEYDAFGPWIDEVRTADQIPRLYRDYLVDFAAARTILKIPRDIERRKANPGMDLYDNLVILTAEELTILTRAEAAYTAVTLALGDIVAMRTSVNLLAGRLDLHSRSAGPVVVRFNSSSRERIDALVDQIRDRAWRGERSAGCAQGGDPGWRGERPGRGCDRAADPDRTEAALAPLAESDLVLVNQTRRDLQADPAARVVAAQARRNISVKAGARAKFMSWLRPLRLTALAVVESGEQVIIRSRASGIAQRRMADYSLAETFIFAPAATGVTADPLVTYHDVTRVSITFASSAITFETVSGCGVQRALAERLGPRRA
ncbi:hypothetical protein [Rarobacter incanus]|uniref:Uncharacterized protein n=1 Tax=Rarobacter incanus TaxID=153494 RepID=A0A542SQ58_9MICO|nr:hypothetical protein [Rarobacter incanus]TQK76734.1 hypothetical protein FB389_1424 [Rarobacter incanus]